VARSSWQWAEAEREYKRAIELNPNYATGYHWYSELLKNLGRFDEAALMIKRANELDPLSGIIGVNFSEMYLIQHNPQAASENCLKMIALDPGFPLAYSYLGMSELALGRNAEAIANIEKAVEISNRDANILPDLGYAYAVSGRRPEALAIARELEEKYAKKQEIGLNVAEVYVGLGDKDRAFEWLEKDLQNKENVADARSYPAFESIRDDPRYKAMLKRMNLPE
jgi:tetratricopeptide (TPR) repeat protein